MAFVNYGSNYGLGGVPFEPQPGPWGGSGYGQPLWQQQQQQGGQWAGGDIGGQYEEWAGAGDPMGRGAGVWPPAPSTWRANNAGLNLDEASGRGQPPRVGTISGMQAPPGYMDPMGQYNQWQQGQQGQMWGGGGPSLQGAPNVAANLLGRQMNNAYGNARLANELRYNQILGGYGQNIRQGYGQLGQLLGGYQQRYQQGIGGLNALQAAEQAQINKRGEQQSAKAVQGLTNAGLGNTTVAPNVQRGVAADTNFASGQLAGQFAGLRTQYGAQLSGDYLGAAGQGLRNLQDMQQQRLGFMERRNDVPPQMGPYLAAMRGLGQGQGGFQNAQAMGYY